MKLKNILDPANQFAGNFRFDLSGRLTRKYLRVMI